MTELAIRVLDRVAPALDRINDRFPWSHNDHFHPWILANLPARRRGAIELGCGQGDLLAQLAGEFRQVHGTDTSAQMRADARARCAELDNVVVDDAQLRDLGPETEPEPVDLVTMIAALHHVDADETLAEAARLLAPGGRLLVVGLALSANPRDYVWEGISTVTNPVIGIAKNLPPRRGNLRHLGTAGGQPDPFPVTDPTTTFDEVAEAARRHLPGAQLRYRVGFRYTLEWTKLSR